MLAERTPTIKDIARISGVSIATVSRVIHGRPGGYSEKTRHLVLKTASELGYRPNALARGLVNKRTHTIGVVFPDVSGSYSSELLHGIEEKAHERGFSVIVCNSDRDGERTIKYLRMLLEKQVDGIIFASYFDRAAYEAELEAMRLPVVLVNTVPGDAAALPYIKVDDRAAAREATGYLLKQGHRDIAMIAGAPDDPVAGRPRLVGYREALRASGVAFREELVAYGDFRFDSGRIAMERLIEEAPPFTALFAASDEMAVGAMSAALTRGLRIPEDLSIVGYDDLIYARMVHPPLTTVHQPLPDMGRRAAELLIARIQDLAGKLEGGSSIVPHRIVERGSVRTFAGQGLNS